MPSGPWILAARRSAVPEPTLRVPARVVRRIRARPGPPEPPAPTRGARWGLIAAAGSAVIVAVLALLLIGLHMPTGRRLVADAIERRLSQSGFTVSIGALEGSPLRAFELLEVKLADAEGPLATADRVRVRVRPFALLLGDLDLRTAEAGRVDVTRLPGPLALAFAAGRTAVTGGPDLPDAVLRFGADQMVLAGGRPGGSRVTGRLETRGEALELRFSAEGIEAPTDRLAADLRIDSGTRRINVQVDSAEGAGGPLALLLDLPRAGPLTLRGRGEGTFDQFHATANLAAASGSADLTMQLGRTGARRTFRIEGNGQLGALVEANLAGAFDGASTLLLAGAVQPDGRIDIQDGRLSTAAASATLRGEVAEHALSLTVGAATGDSAALATLLPAGLAWRELSAEASVTGDPADPAITLALAGDEASLAVPRLGSISAGSATGRVRRSPGGGSPPSWAVEFQLAGAAASDPAMARMLGAEASGEITAIAEDGAWQVRQSTLRGAGASLAYAGALGPDGIRGTYSAKGLDIGLLAPVLARPVSGKLDSVGEIAFEPAEGRLRGTLGGTASEIRTGDARLDAALAGTVALSGGFSGDGAGFGLSNLAASGQKFSLRGNGASTGGGVAISLALPDLAVLDPNLSGAGTLGGTLGGNLAEPLGEMTLAIPKGTLQGWPLERVALVISAARNAAGMLDGSVRLDGTVAGQPVMAAGSLSRTIEGRLSLQPIELMAGGIQAGGTLAFDPATGQPEGRFSFSVASLAEIGTVLTWPVSGRAQGVFDIQAAPRGPNLRIQGVAADLRFDRVRGAARNVAFAGEWIGRRPARGAFAAEGVAVHGYGMDRLRGTVIRRETALLLAVDGAAGKTTFSGRGRAVPLPDETRIGFETMLVEAEGERLVMPNPTLIRLRGDSMTIDEVIFRSGEGQLSVSGTMGKGLDLTLAANCMPLALVRLFSPETGMVGCVSGNATVKGTRDSPLGKGDLTLTDAGAATPGAEKVTGRIEVNVTTESASGKATLKGSRTDLALEGSWPFGDGPVILRGKGKLDLESLGALAQLPGLAGTLSGQVGVGGTLAEPRVEGSLDLAGGSLPSLGISEAVGSATARGRDIELARLRMKLPKGGRLSAHGPIALGAAEGAGFDVTVDLESTELAPSPALRLRGDAALRIVGPQAALRLEGLVAVREGVLTAGGAPAAVTLPPGIAQARVRITAPNRLRLTGRGMDGELAGDILLDSEGEKVGATGELRMRSGTLALGETKTRLAGSLSFAQSLDPALTLLSEGRDASGSARLAVRGSLSAPEMRLSADPPADPQAALLRLLTASGASERARRPDALAEILRGLQPPGQ